jgi:hypothetical protein
MMPPRYLLALATTLLSPAGYAAETGKAASSAPAELGFYNSQSIEDCMAMWDPLTHMTKAQWRTTCDRIRAERLPYLEGKHVD